jgi:hypothetical protein
LSARFLPKIAPPPKAKAHTTTRLIINNFQVL